MLSLHNPLLSPLTGIVGFGGQRLDYAVISCTSQSDLFPASNLACGSGTPGWVSQELCTYPQALVLDLSWPCMVTAVHVIAHRFFIPTIVDLHALNGISTEQRFPFNTTGSQCVPIAQFHFEPVDSGQPAWRHQQMTFQPALPVGRWLKVTCRYYHPSPNNLYSQVGLTCVEICGQKIASLGPQNMTHPGALVPLTMRSGWRNDVATADDYAKTSNIFMAEKSRTAAFKPGKDATTVQQLLVSLENYKQAAVDGTRRIFAVPDLSRQLRMRSLKCHKKQTLSSSKKDSAIEEENFRLADNLKYDILKLTVKAMNLLKEHNYGNLLEKGQLRRLEEMLKKRTMPEDGGVQRTPAERDIHTVQFRDHAVPPEFTPATPTSSARRSTLMRPREGSRLSTTRDGMFIQTAKKAQVTRAPKLKISEYAGDIQSALTAFGEDIVNKAPSGSFRDRVQVVEAVNSALDRLTAAPDITDPPPLTFLQGSIVLLDIMIKEDPAIVQLIVQTVLKMFRSVFPLFPQAKEEFLTVLQMALGFSFARLASTNRRIPQILMPFVVQMAMMENIKAQNMVVKACCDALKPTSQARYALNRLRIIQDLAAFLLDTPESCLTTDLLVRFAMSAMGHHEREVRRSGERLIIHLYGRPPPSSFLSFGGASQRTAAYRDHIRSLLPPPPTDADKAKRNFKYRRLYHVLAEMDAGDMRNAVDLDPPLSMPFETVDLPSERNADDRIPNIPSNASAKPSKSLKTMALRKLPASQRHLSPISDTSDPSKHHPDTSGEQSLLVRRKSSSTLLSTRSVSEQSRPHATKSAATSNIVFPAVTPENVVEKVDYTEAEADEAAVPSDQDKTVPEKVVPLVKKGKYWKHLQVIAAALESEGCRLVEKKAAVKELQKHSSIVSVCPYCGKPDLVKELNWHLYQECPLLKMCSYCDNKILVWELNGHWLGKCTKRPSMAPCSRCGLAIPLKQLKDHMSNADCLDVSLDEGAATCPLCRQCVQNTDDGWIAHLLGDNQHGCRKNKRRIKALKWSDTA
ncbi:uncharacterized protein LOC129581708 [Paramacrobiotus metropolitanus]|uniref:uncharacterized protein LOC129581708 n=1 Tax=Paramacrobiotus metropolitanus TaxID=2943436 RepID=UPI0024459A96|nr:uncharacterized protein LOC129581708 [Paramacrobiotus metropolitanus]